MKISKLRAMLRHAEKQRLQRENSPVEKHAKETYSIVARCPHCGHQFPHHYSGCRVTEAKP